MSRVVVHLIPHTHWDREWYLPLGGLRSRLVAMVDGLIDLLEREPAIPSFLLDGQTVLLEDYLAVRPERRGQVGDLVRAGRIVTGPWYVLADEQIPSGESLLRNLHLGAIDCRALGRSMEVIYSPDAFGHPASLPAVGSEFGLSRAVVWRGLSGSATREKDLIWWRAADGRRVLTCHLPPDGYEIGSNLLVAPDRLKDAWKRIAAVILSRAGSRHVAVPVGADHHAAGPQLVSLPARLSVIDQNVEFRLSSFDDFFSEAEPEAERLGEIEGELRRSYGYTWTLQGTLATRAHLKRRNSRVELLLTRRAEPLAGLAGLRAGRSDRAILAMAWRELIQCHFHDAICGCCNDAVARAVEVRLDDVESAGREVLRTTVDAVVGHDPDLARDGAPTRPRLVVWNGAARARGGVVVAEASFFVRDVLVGPPGARRPGRGEGFERFALTEVGSGMTVAAQILSIVPGLERRDAARHYPDQDEVERVRFAFPLPRGLGGFGVREFEPVRSEAEPMEDFAAVSAGSVWNGRVMATVERNGTVSLEEPTSGELYPGLFQLESERDGGDTYSFCPVRGDRIRTATRPVKPIVESAGPLVSALSWRAQLSCGEGATRGLGKVRVDWRLEVIGDAPAVLCRLTVENQARNHRLRLRLPTGIRRGVALAGAQFGAISRGAVKPSRPAGEWPVTTAPAHRWVAAAKKNRGLALFAPGFFEYEWTATGDLLITLFRAVGELSRGDLRSRPGHAGWPMPTPLAQCQGEETLELGVAPIQDSDLESPDRLERIWEDLFVPPEGRWIRESTVLPVEPTPTIELEGEGLVFSSCVGGAERGELILRCFNQSSEAVAGAWSFSTPVVRARRIRADGTVLDNLEADGPTGNRIPFVAGKREILTFHLTL